MNALFEACNAATAGDPDKPVIVAIMTSRLIIAGKVEDFTAEWAKLSSYSLSDPNPWATTTDGFETIYIQADQCVAALPAKTAE